MKTNILFKTLIDFLFLILILGLAVTIFTIPIVTKAIDPIDLSMIDWGFLHWGHFILKILASLIFMIGLFFLRKVARFLLLNKCFSAAAIINLRKCGFFFISSGAIYLFIFLVALIGNLFYGKIVLSLDVKIIGPLFTCITGLFLIIQSKTLLLAKNYKEENELTV